MPYKDRLATCPELSKGTMYRFMVFFTCKHAVAESNTCEGRRFMDLRGSFGCDTFSGFS